MIAKMYKGPFHNKKREVRDDAPFILVNGKLSAKYEFDAPAGIAPSFLMGRYKRTHHTHPDGSVFFVWDGWN